jgi:ABC-2 type transport system ATP-binding protein
MSSALRITDLTKSFKVGFIPKTIRALNGISLEVEQGEIFGLLGPNGAGKTTTIKCILSLIHPDSGRIELLGDPVPSRKAKAKIGFLSENPYVYDFLTGREYLQLAANLHGLSSTACNDKADELISFFHLETAANRPLRGYSKGMLQKIGLAQALINDPEFLIMDEPMSGLDPFGRKEVRDLLLSLKGKGKTLLFSSHILADAELICDRVAIIVGGKLVTTGKLQDQLKKIRGYEVTLTLNQKLKLDGIEHQVIAVSDFQMLIQVPSIKQIDEILGLSKTQNFQIESIEPQRQTLEELYLKETGNL